MTIVLKPLFGMRLQLRESHLFTSELKSDFFKIIIINWKMGEIERKGMCYATIKWKIILGSKLI